MYSKILPSQIPKTDAAYNKKLNNIFDAKHNYNGKKISLELLCVTDL